MRRIIIIGTALAAMAGGTAASASSDPNNYTGSISVSPAKAGKPKKPVIDSWTQTINVTSANPSLSAAPLTDIKTWIYGLTVTSKVAPTCSSAKIESTSGTKCPGRSLVASGTVSSRLASPDRTSSVNCGPLTLNVYNGGKNFVWFFFIVSHGPASCPGAHTGSAAPYKGTFTRSHGNLVFNVKLPPDVSTNAANIGAFAGLTSEHLVWKKLTKRINGKKVGYFSSVGCKAGKRPWKVTYTDTTSSSRTTAGSTTQSGKLSC